MTKLQAAYQYADDIVNGRITAGQLVINACERFHNDLKRTDGRIRFNEAKAKKALRFFKLLPHVKGDLTGKPIDLMPWHCFVVANLFGWEMLREEGWSRRFRKAYLEVARKNAKSTLLSGIGLYGTGFDGEGGSEVFSAATTRDQARIVFGDAANMIRTSPPLSQLFKALRLEITQVNGTSTFKPVSSDANTLDGLNAHVCLVDEYHAHPTSDVYDVLESSQGARSNPLMLIITTAGFNLEGPCYLLRKQYIEPLLKGSIDDDSYFAMLYTLDDGDDPFDEKNWIKANPGLGVCKRIDTLREEAKKAQHMVTAKVNFLTKHVNQWVQASEAFIDIDAWKRCPQSVSDEELSQYPCYIGVDLARQWDWTAVVLAFKLPQGGYDVRVKFFLPEDSMLAVNRLQNQMYQRFVDQGDLILTQGNILDQESVRDSILDFLKIYSVRSIGYDAYSSAWLLTQLQHCGVDLVPVAQSTKALTPAMGELASRIMEGSICNPGNDALTWHLGNVVLRQKDAKNMYPAKESDGAKIDGAVALMMAIHQAMGDTTPDYSAFLSNPLTF